MVGILYLCNMCLCCCFQLLLCQTPQPHSTYFPTLRSLPVFLHWIPTFNIHLCNKNGGGHQGTLDYTMTMWKTMLKRWSAIWLCCTVPLAPHHAPLLPVTVTVPSSPSLSPPSHHCPLLPITVPSSPSLSPPSHHCPLLPITVPSFPSLSPPPLTVPSSPSHHVIMADCFFPLLSRYSLLPTI